MPSRNHHTQSQNALIWAAIVAATLGAGTMGMLGPQTVKAQDAGTTPAQSTTATSTADKSDAALVVNGRVPVSVAVRQQSPEVEAIIKQLEEKAKAAQGTWTTTSGRQDEPGTQWTSGIDGAKWYWQSQAKDPSPTTGLILFNDGYYDYILPYGKDNTLGAERFQYDTLRTWQAGDYVTSHYLLHMNLMPRQFIGAFGGLKIVGEETVPTDTKAGTAERLIHLRADPKDDPLLGRDPAINYLWSSDITRKMIVDLYYSAEAQSIAKLVVTSKENAAVRVEMSVDAWEAFGTNYQWPKKLESHVYKITTSLKTSSIGEAGKPVLTTVNAFVPGKNASFDEIQNKVASVPFYLTSPTELRTTAFYHKSLSRNDNCQVSLSDRVALAQESFLTENIADGLEQWAKVDEVLQNQGDKEKLGRAIGPMASTALYDVSERLASQSDDQRLACAGVLKRIVTTLDGATFKSAAYGTVIGWDRLRHAKDTAAIASQVTPELLQKCTANGNVFVFEKLVRLAEASKEDATLIDPALNAGIVQKPIPSSGFSNSMQDYLLVGAIRANALDRAKSYAGAFVWGSTATPSQKQVVELWCKMVPVAESLQANDDEPLLEAMRGYAQFVGLKPGIALTDNVYGRSLLTEAGAHLIKARLEPASTKVGPTELIQRTMRADGAGNYWKEVLEGIATTSAIDPTTMMRVSSAIHTYAQTFNDSQFEIRLWVGLANDRRLAGKFLGVELQYLNKALAAANDDTSKVQVITAIAQTFARVHEYVKGASAVEQASQLVQDQKLKNRLAIVVEALKANQKV